ncbi:pseudouridine synthase [Acidithiobacillus sulfurivorans]|uniref:pseudouridine synthase n=1 Tax=Acidithiobacillus sulfurivorans TaxID=1958756 RepID=UPI001D00F8B1|nr:pseudouridine synthase [Acidithiobacillus sulfurivorans]
MARLLSKAGLCSRSIAADWIRAGKVTVNGQIIYEPEARFSLQDQISVAGQRLQEQARKVLMLHKPRGVVSTRADERGRPTVYDLLPSDHWLAPIGRLDQASSGLLLFSNDPEWAQGLLNPDQHVSKTYHVQIRPPLPAEVLQHIARHSSLDGKPCLPMQIRELRCGGKTQWLEMVLQEGRNRQIRRLLQDADAEVLRLIRVAVGDLLLGSLTSGQWRWLSPDEERLLEL